MLRATALCAAVLLLLSGCGGDGDVTQEGQTDPIEVEVGKAFSWNGFSVADGWKLEETDVARGIEQGTMPVVEGDITNDGETTRFALLQFNFASGDARVATVPCTTGKLKVGASAPLDCSGLSSSYPQDFDRVTVTEIKR